MPRACLGWHLRLACCLVAHVPNSFVAGAGLLELLGGESLSQPAAARVRGVVIGTGSAWCFLCTAHDAGSRPRPHSALLILFGIDGLRAGSSAHPVRSAMPCVGPQRIGIRFWPALGLPRPSTSPPRIISHTYARARTPFPATPSLTFSPSPCAQSAAVVINAYAYTSDGCVSELPCLSLTACDARARRHPCAPSLP